MTTRPASTPPPPPAQDGVRAAVLVGMLAACTGAPKPEAPVPADDTAEPAPDDTAAPRPDGVLTGIGRGPELTLPEPAPRPPFDVIDLVTPVECPGDRDCDGHTVPDDCDDTDPATFPGAAEVCGDGRVNDCARRAVGWTDELCAVQTEALLEIRIPGDGVAEGAYIGDLRGDGSFYLGVGIPDATACDVIGYDEWGSEIWDCYRIGGAYLLETGLLRPSSSGNALWLPNPGAPGVGGVDGHLRGRGYGSSLEGLGDFDGDGFADFIMGNTQSSAGETDEVWLFWGPNVPERFDEGTRLYIGDEPRRCIGYDMQRAGDLTGDGRDDLIVGDPCTNQAWVWSGADVLAAAGENIEPEARILDAGEELIELGMALSGGHDLTGDGLADLVVSAPNPGRPDNSDLDHVGVYEGPFAGDRDADDRVATVRTSLVKAESSEHAIGETLDVGDLNGDGYADLVVGDSEWYDSPGRAATGETIIGLTTVYYGPVGGDYIDSEAEVRLYFGSGEVEAHTDFDGDGRDDLLVGSGSHRREGGAGPYNIGPRRAALVYSPLSGVVDLSSDADVDFRQPEDDVRIDTWGAQVIAVPDQSGDGVPDVIVGSIGDAFWLMPVPLPVPVR